MGKTTLAELLGNKCLQWQTPFVDYCYADFLLNEELKFYLDNPNQKNIYVLYLLRGHKIQIDTDPSTSLQLNQKQFALIYCTKNQSQINLTCLPSERIELLVIGVSAVWFQELETLREVFEQEKIIPVNKTLNKVVNMSIELADCISGTNHLDRFAGKIKDCYLELKVQEILLLSVEAYKNSLKEHEEIDTGALEKMTIIHDLLTNNPDREHSLKNLAETICSNTTFVKLNFKKIYGKTVFEYLQQVRMEKSLQLLKQKTHSVTEIASQVGYKHATHFTAAFKKYYGLSPKKIK